MSFLSAAQKTALQSVFDATLTDWGKVCRLIYPVKMETCDCTQNHWTSGGSVDFPSTCALCNGTGTKAVEVTEDVTMLIAWEPKTFFSKFPANIQVPDGTIQTKCLASLQSKIIQASRMLVVPENSGQNRWIFELASEAKDIHNIFQGRYVVYTWNRAS